MKKILAILLTLVMLLGMVACAAKTETVSDAKEATAAETEEAAEPGETTETEDTASEGGIPSWLHPGQKPLVDEPVTLRCAVIRYNDLYEPEESWMYHYIEEVLGVTLEVEYFFVDSRDESVALMMASGDLPDIMIGLGLSSAEISNYGEAQGLLLDMAPYLTAENAPNLNALYEEYPAYLSELTTSTGHTYSIGGVCIDNKTNFNSYWTFYNVDDMENMGYTEEPKTLDEFVQMLRDLKASKGDSAIPFGGNYSKYNQNLYLILNALGYNRSKAACTQNILETDICMRNGEIVMPAYDKEAFPAYLETLHTMYEEGLMEQDYYTIDNETVEAHLTSGLYSVFGDIAGCFGGLEFGQQWWGVTPLTSEYNDTAFWPNYTGQTIGQFAVSADTEYPELCVALADIFYGEDSYAIGYGPTCNDTDILCGFDGYSINPETGEYIYAEYEGLKDQIEYIGDYQFSRYSLWYPATFRADDETTWFDENGNDLNPNYDSVTGDTYMEIAKFRKETTTLDDQYCAPSVLCVSPYKTDEITPTTFYFDAETNARVAELKTLIEDYAQQEIAKFVIGERDLSEINDYFDELSALGADEYVGYYRDYYAAQNS